MNESMSTSDGEPPKHPTWLDWGWKNVRRVIVFITGMTVLIVGLAMVLLPGPAMVVIPLGLAILATEFTWAAWALRHARKEFVKMASYANDKLGLPYGERIKSVGETFDTTEEKAEERVGLDAESSSAENSQS